MRFTLVKKLVLGFGAGVLITVIIVAFNYLQLGNLKKLQDIGFVKAHEAVLSKELSGMGYKLYQDIANFQINKNSVDNEKNWEELKNEFTADLENMKSASDTDEEKRWSNDANIKYLDMVKIVENEMLPLIKADADKNKIIALDDKIDGDLNDFNKILNDYSASIDRDMVNEDKNYDSTMSNVISVSIILTVIGVLLAVIMAYFITTSIRKDVGGEPSVISGITEQVSKGDLSIEFSSKNPTGILSSVINMVESLKIKSSTLEKISNGNLDVEVEMSSEKDELGKSMTRLVDSLNKIISQVNIAVEQVATGSTQVSAASQSLSQGATEQASSLEEITSSVGEINSQTIQNSENAVKANELSKNAMDNARKGNEQMNELVTSMNTINKSAQEIKKIVKAIDDIAFQINLLALNANVEAARAGKYGKGFAVVADEVRNLAVRSTGSVKETTAMVEEATKNIESGNKLVEITAKQLEEILGSSSKVAELVEEIASASKEQTQGVEQVNLGLEQVDQVTQATTANAEECASTAEELASQAQQLKGLMMNFKLKIAGKTAELNSLTPEILEMIRTEMSRNKDASKSISEDFHHENTLKNLKKIKTKIDSTKHDGKIINPKDVISLDDQDFGKF